MIIANLYEVNAEINGICQVTNDLEFDLDKVERKNANNDFWTLQVSRNKMIYVDKSLHEMHTEAKITTPD